MEIRCSDTKKWILSSCLRDLFGELNVNKFEFQRNCRMERPIIKYNSYFYEQECLVSDMIFKEVSHLEKEIGFYAMYLVLNKEENLYLYGTYCEFAPDHNFDIDRELTRIMTIDKNVIDLERLCDDDLRDMLSMLSYEKEFGVSIEDVNT